MKIETKETDTNEDRDKRNKLKKWGILKKEKNRL